MKDVVIICTLNRPRELVTTVESLMNQSCKPDEIIVVDASGRDQIKSELKSLSERYDSKLITHTRSSPGLPRQRNLGLGLAISKYGQQDLYVHFVDDDVTVDQEYLEKAREEFTTYPDAVLIGGRDRLRVPRKHSLIGRLGRTDSKREGVILRSGYNIVYEANEGTKEVDWVSGLSQSFRANLLGDIRFDDSIRFYGEEVDMHVRVAKAGKIYWSNNMLLQHRESAEGRESASIETFELDKFRRNLCEKYPQRFSKTCFYYATFSHLTMHFLKYLLSGDRRSVEIARGHTRFLFQSLKSKVNKY